MPLLISLITLLLVSIGQAHTQQDDGSANYVLPLCKTWVKLATDTEVEEVGSIAKIESYSPDHFRHVCWSLGRYLTDATDVGTRLSDQFS